MTDTSHQPQRTIPMIVATSVLKPGRLRIGKIGNSITLPRTVAVVSLVAVAIGAMCGSIVGLIIGQGLESLAIAAALGGGAGWVVVNYSPLKNESFMTWLGLTVKTRRGRVMVNGQPVRVAIGICPIDKLANGPTHIQRGAVDIQPSSYDERGVLISKKNHNLDRASSIVADLLGDTSPHLPHIPLHHAPQQSTPPPHASNTTRPKKTFK